MTRLPRRPAWTHAIVVAAGLGVCVLGAWQSGRVAWPEPERDARREACDGMRRMAASTRDTARDVAALDREMERMFRDTAASAAVRLAEERGRDPDAAAGRGPFDADAVADNERWAEGQRRSAEEWDRLAAKAEAELAAVSQKCGGDHG